METTWTLCSQNTNIRVYYTCRTAGQDEVSSDILNHIEVDHATGHIYKSVIISWEYLRSTFICMQKKENPKECSGHRTISFM